MENTVPVDFVLKLRNLGYSNQQIIGALQAQGFKSHQIYDALSQADMNDSRVREVPFENGNLDESPKQASIEYPQQQETGYANYPQGQAGLDTDMVDKIQQISEQIIEERWTDIVNNMRKVAEWKERTEDRIKNVELKLGVLTEQVKSIEESVLDRMKQYDTHVVQFSSDFKAMEMVFKDVIPKFTQGIQELSRLVDDFKEKVSPNSVKGKADGNSIVRK